MSSTVSLKIEFGGGLELLFSNQRSHRIILPAQVPSGNPASSKAAASPSDAEVESAADGRPVDIAYLIFWLRDNLLKERAELFAENESVWVLQSRTMDAFRSCHIY